MIPKFEVLMATFIIINFQKYCLFSGFYVSVSNSHKTEYHLERMIFILKVTLARGFIYNSLSLLRR